MIVRYEPFKQIFLFGGTPLIGKLAKRLSDYFTVHVYTAPRQAADVPEIEGVSRFVTADVNEILEPFEIGNALGIGLGEAWRFGPKLREAFGPRLIDFMSIPYPRYLGGAHVTHAILRGERRWGACMQLVTENTVQGEVHDGDVIYSESFPFPTEDEHHQLERLHLDFIANFVDKAFHGYEFKTESQCGRAPLYLPRLNTLSQGWVDWSWYRFAVLRFIRAFDKPYPGARTIAYDGQQPRMVTLHDPIDLGHSDGHPFQAGIITDIVRTVHDTRATVSVDGGSIAVTIRDDIGKDPTWLRVGMRLHTDAQTLDRAKTYTPVYSPIGDVAHARS